MKLYIHGVEAQRGMSVKTFRGESCTLAGWTEPSHLGSSGRVEVHFLGGGVGEYFPSVIGAEFRD